MSSIAGKAGAFFQYYSANDKSKLIADFQDDETWTSGAGTQSDDGVNYRLGVESIKILEDDNTGSFLYSDQNSITLNLATFTSGAASDTSDYIYLICYVSDSTKVTDIRIGFSTEATYDGDPSYAYTISTGINTGWNYFKIKKSAFTSTNMSDWTGIQSIRVGWTSTNSAQNAYISFQSLYLIDNLFDLTFVNNSPYILEQIGLVANWNIDLEVDMLDDTALADNWKSNISGLKGWSCSIEKYWEDNDYYTNAGTAVQLVLYTTATSGYRYEGQAIINTDGIETPVDDLVTESVEFTGDSQLYYTNLVIKDS
jgi:hypothetical protein